jgi:hypothetical protein
VLPTTTTTTSGIRTLSVDTAGNIGYAGAPRTMIGPFSTTFDTTPETARFVPITGSTYPYAMAFPFPGRIVALCQFVNDAQNCAVGDNTSYQTVVYKQPYLGSDTATSLATTPGSTCVAARYLCTTNNPVTFIIGDAISVMVTKSEGGRTSTYWAYLLVEFTQ